MIMFACNNFDSIFIFIDFSKAFDSIDRNTMFEILELYGIPKQMVEAIKLLYTNNTATVLSPDGETKPFDIKAGILQGDTLAPFLFIMVVDYILRMSLNTQKEKGLLLKARTSSRHPADYNGHPDAVGHFGRPGYSPRHYPCIHPVFGILFFRAGVGLPGWPACCDIHKHGHPVCDPSQLAALLDGGCTQ